MSVEEARRETLPFLDSEDPADVGYIDEQLIAAYEEATEIDSAKGDEGLAVDPSDAVPEAGVYYGNRLLARSGGRLYFSNGSPNRPNDPCGQRNRWLVYMTRGSYYERYRNCGSFWEDRRLLIARVEHVRR